MTSPSVNSFSPPSNSSTWFFLFSLNDNSQLSISEIKNLGVLPDLTLSFMFHIWPIWKSYQHYCWNLTRTQSEVTTSWSELLTSLIWIFAPACYVASLLLDQLQFILDIAAFLIVAQVLPLFCQQLGQSHFSLLKCQNHYNGLQSPEWYLSNLIPQYSHLAYFFSILWCFHIKISILHVEREWNYAQQQVKKVTCRKRNGR